MPNYDLLLMLRARHGRTTTPFRQWATLRIFLGPVLMARTEWRLEMGRMKIEQASAACTFRDEGGGLLAWNRHALNISN